MKKLLKLSIKNKIIYFLFFIFFVFLLFYFPIAFAAAYKWTDENNQVHYGERPPENRNTTAEVIKTVSPRVDDNKPDRATVKAGTEAENTAQDKTQNKSVDDPVAIQKQKDLDKIRSYNCETATKKLASLKNNEGRRIKSESPAGEIHYLDQAEREALSAKARLEMEEYCKK